MKQTVALLCDRVDDTGGVERYWATVIPALEARGIRVELIAREVAERQHFGSRATEIRWAAEDERPSEAAAESVRAKLRAIGATTVITAGVFDRHVLHAVRATAPRWVVRIHDHRAFCPQGDRVYPQFSGICSERMGGGCLVNALVHGCMNGAHPETLRRLADRTAVRDEIARAHAVLVSTEHMRATVTRNGVPAERIAVTPPPLPDAAFCETIHAPPKRRMLLFAGRLAAAKGLRSLLGALARIAPAARPLLIVAGRGDDEPHARRFAAEHWLDVHWAGWLDAATLRAAIDGATAICVPSLWPEPFGLVGSEAQARGRPAVAYNVGGIADWLGDAGITVPRGDENALARAIIDVMDPLQWPLRAHRALHRAQRYRLDAHVDALLVQLGLYAADSVSSSLAVGAANGSASRAESAGASGSRSSSS